MSAPGLLLIWNGATPVFEALIPTAGKWKLGRQHPAWEPPDARMSREHCEVHHTDGEWHFHDLGSVNGTRVDGTPTSDHVRHPEFKVLQVGHSLLIPYRPPIERPDACHLDAFADRPDFASLADAARSLPTTGDWRPEIVWWVHHAYQRLGPFELEVAFVAAHLRHDWRTRGLLLDNLEAAPLRLPAGSRRLVRECFLHIDPRDDDHEASHAVEFSVAGGRYERGPAEMTRLRDPAIIKQALDDAGGDLRKAADALKITVEALHQWMRRHNLITS